VRGLAGTAIVSKPPPRGPAVPSWPAP